MPRLSQWRGTVLLLATSCLALSVPAAAQAPTAQAAAVNLKVGDMAPAFTPGTWIKGEPLSALAKGQVYVLEFWATWCGPCKAAIPHVSGFAKKYAGKITFIGVNVLETGKTPEDMDQKVKDFVKEKGATMDYLVCRDTRDEQMNTNWMKAAGLEGIPATFIVDGSGRLVWQGHPMAMEPVLEKVAAGTFDPVAEKAAADANAEVERAIGKEMAANNWQGVMDLLPKYKALDPVSKDWGGYFKFMALLRLDPNAAQEMFDRMHKERPDLTITYLGQIAAADGLAKSWYTNAATELKELVKKDKVWYGMLAKVQAKAGDFKGAAKSKAADIKQLRARIPEILKEHPDAGAMIKSKLAEEEAKLKEYRSAAAKQH
ncbi:MAG: TlpA family protein disulfide reductase [Geothrix sp.]|uniref:TlpA disulfide reductase family protein n=1 Tax=Geothrix sp. TaxID=1962974 RepID=UPI0017C3BB1C|nr:TlpA disulfide reductase family protein [Geothrix sp.]NWJ42493.1 TlpA family protein disulfide reductase [Geothrix sp.]WIL19545.1 MAG: TlpA family protein disulfide reductase [Geothrix sp.]